MNPKILIEGASPEEILEYLKDPEFEGIVVMDEPIIFHIGSAEVLAQFSLNENELDVDLVEIRGGGEGILITLTNLMRKYAEMKALKALNWHVYARTCAHPNPKLKRVLELRRFEVRNDLKRGEIYFQREGL